MQELPANVYGFLQDAVWPVSTFHVDPDQPDPRPNPAPNPNPLGDSRSAGAIARLCRVFWWRFPKKSRRPKTQSRPIRLLIASCRKFSAGIIAPRAGRHDPGFLLYIHYSIRSIYCSCNRRQRCQRNHTSRVSRALRGKISHKRA